MSGKLSDYEVQKSADLRRADLVTNPPKLILFTNNYTPTTSTVLADLTEATFPGYSRHTLDFSGSSSLASHVASLTPVAEVFTRSAGGSGQDVYGYGVLDSTGTYLLWSERDPAAPIDMSVIGATYTVTAVRKNQSN